MFIIILQKNSVIGYFEKENMIPHPKFSPCARELKIEPMNKYFEENDLDFDLVGYVKEEKRRTSYQKNNPDLQNKIHPIQHLLNEDCFNLVKQEIGWYPAIYDFRNKQGERVFKHNNCLPCKNMTQNQIDDVKKYYPEYWGKADNLSKKLNKYWGRLPTIQNYCDSCSFD